MTTRKQGQWIGFVLATLLTTALWALPLTQARGQGLGYVPAPVFPPLVITDTNHYEVPLVWTRSLSPSVIGYYVYATNATEFHMWDAGAALSFSAVLPKPVARLWFSVTGYDRNGLETPKSNETWNPGDIVVSLTGRILVSPNLLNWWPTNTPLNATNPTGSLFMRPELTNWVDHGNPAQ